MKTALIITQATATPEGISLAWVCGEQSGLITSTDLDVLACLLAALVRRLLMIPDSIKVEIEAPWEALSVTRGPSSGP